MTKLLDGISARRVPTERLTVNVLERTGTDDTDDTAGPVVLFVHGNVSSSLFWQQAMLDLPAGYRAMAVDLRGFGDTDPAPVDATRGLRDYADDLRALIAELELGKVHLVGWSMGGGVLMQYLLDAPSTVASLTLMAPVSPFGFGGTKGLDGELCHPRGAGSGGGTGNPEFVSRLAKRDTSDESPLSPRSVLRAHYVKPGTRLGPEDAYVDSMLSTRLGDDHYPGTFASTDDWPGVLPGERGVLNAMAPTHFRIADLSGVTPKPPILWIRGTDDVIVSDTSLYDFGYLGRLGAVPGWPGEEQWPPQPMIAQTRAVLDGYGAYQEVVIEDAGHGPHLDKPDEFNRALHAHLASV
ncbi:alpha/beta fold hydrolase [Labedaea rhizosphaerae]|uniref:Pimeloyl-ACP methyl ester carboxylesterase n=1 Tax=Labedaea rhizosphaerae TaxID=598644 RepID=A0A4R6SC09_LABRH|nr:alpha/beta hydrolase [Labedaea rhizosphaerae]TDP97502.1 pimeloyl-ACP methyl ester carboxylesterase [Labedaea rhizosphaerae]